MSQDCLNMLMDWDDKWGMNFITSKCKVMHVGTSNLNIQYNMSGHMLGTTETERDIGVLVSANMKPARQCQKAAQTAGSVLGQISRAFHYRDRKTFVKLYKQYVRPHLEFAVTAWSPWTVAEKECLERVQMRAIKMVSGLISSDYHERLAELGMETLEERRHRMDMAQVYKIVTGEDKVDRDTWFTYNGERRTKDDKGKCPSLEPETAEGKAGSEEELFFTACGRELEQNPHSDKGHKNVSSFKRLYGARRDKVDISA